MTIPCSLQAATTPASLVEPDGLPMKLTPLYKTKTKEIYSVRFVFKLL